MSKEIQVLFLDDEEGIIDTIQRSFRKESYGVFATTKLVDVRDALEKYKIKVVVSDYRMPDISGIHFLQEVRMRYPDTVRILFTGYTDLPTMQEAIDRGDVYKIVNKPWEMKEFLTLIGQCIERYDLMVNNKTKEV